MLRRLFGLMGPLPGHLRLHSSFQHAPSKSAGPSVSDLDDIFVAALFSTIVNEMPPIEDALTGIAEHLEEEVKAAVSLDVGLGAQECGIVFRYGNKIVLAFGATHNNKQLSTSSGSANNKRGHRMDGTTRSAESPEYSRCSSKHQGQPLHPDMWLSLRNSALATITDIVTQMADEGQSPSSFLITGHCVGGAISTSAIMDVVEHIRKTFGQLQANPKDWAIDAQLGKIIRHITFAEYCSTELRSSNMLAQFYSQYGIFSWDLVHPRDFSTVRHFPYFRESRSHRCLLPGPAVVLFEEEYGRGNHNMLGYLRSVEWLRNHGQMLHSIYEWEECASTYP